MKSAAGGPDQREPVYRTRPGTPMIGPYSVNQMDDFYDALAHGQVKPTGIMNYVQHLFVAERCPPGARVVDVCCGRGLQLPVLYRYAALIERYVGLDIAPGALAEARHRVEKLNRRYGDQPFGVELIKCDVAGEWPDIGPFDVAIYTSALEHLPRELGIASVRRAAAALVDGGRLYLSTPNTVGNPTRPLQCGVHVHEWSTPELRPVLTEAGLVVDEMVGLLPPPSEQVVPALTQQFGPDAASWYLRLRDALPAPFLGTMVAAALPDAATEVLYVCTRRAR